jgi:hypothetical protein
MQTRPKVGAAMCVPLEAAGRMEKKHFTTKGGSGIMNVVAAQPHVTLSGDRVGEYVIEEERPEALRAGTRHQHHGDPQAPWHPRDDPRGVSGLLARVRASDAAT